MLSGKTLSIMKKSILPFVVIVYVVTTLLVVTSVSAFAPSSKVASTKSQSALYGEPLQIGLFGGGTVGGGIVGILDKKKAYFEKMTGRELKIKTICVRDVNKPRDFELPEGCSITENYDDILNDDSLEMVVEVIGGTTKAKDVIYSALKSGKHVVTANKALIAAYMPEISALLNEINAKASGKSVEFRYEAAVCGGIPIIRTLQTDFVGDSINMVSGIINGCTNFMLTAMDRDGKSYEEALAEAAQLGYAEEDPTLDVGGFDARSKLKILMRLAYGVQVSEDDISCKGITELSKLDFEYAKMMGGSIKLIGFAKRVSDDKVAAFVSPCYVSAEDSLYAVSGATNAVEIISENLVSTTLIGEGAGRYPTANSCVNDMIALAKGDKTQLPFNPSTEMKFVNNYESDFYIRLKYRDALGITRQCGEICEKYGVSIHSILQNPISKRDDAVFVLITEKVELSKVKQVCAEIEALDWCKGPIFYMPVLRELA